MSSGGWAAGAMYEYRVIEFNGQGDSAATCASGTTQPGTANQFGEPLTSSVIGAAASADAVRGSAILSDGSVVIAGNFAPNVFAGLTPTYLAGGTSSSTAAIVLLSRDGSTVQSVTRLPGTVWELSSDNADNLYVALGSGGAIKLNAALTTVLWHETSHQGDRIDAAPNGDVAVLDGVYTSATQDVPSGGGTIYVYTAAGTLQGSFNGLNRTHDVAIDEDTQSVFTTGFKQTTGPSGNPVQIAYLRSQDYQGAQRWRGYDWTSTQVDDPNSGGTGPTNNMADTRGLRLDMGGDAYHSFSNSKNQRLSAPCTSATMLGPSSWMISACSISGAPRFPPIFSWRSSVERRNCPPEFTGRVLVMRSEEGEHVKTVPDCIGATDVPAWTEVAGLSASDLRWRNASDAKLLSGSQIQIGAGGQLGRRQEGKAMII